MKKIFDYANCFEDANLLLAAATNKTHILSIASAIDNSLIFLTRDNTFVTAIDYNDAQLFLSKLKIAAFKHLSYEEVLSFFGIKKRQKEIFLKIEQYLDKDVYDFFKKYETEIFQKGLINLGKFEGYFKIVKKYLFLTIGKKKVEKLFSFDTIEEQRIYYQSFDNFFYRFLFKVLSSKKFLMKGRDSYKFSFVSKDAYGILKKNFDDGFNNSLLKNNPYMQYVFLNKFLTLPPYLKKENFEKIKSNIANIDIMKGNIFTFQTKKQFDFLNMSDVFEYSSEEVCQQFFENFQNNILDNGKILFYNMLVSRVPISNIYQKVDFSPKSNQAFFYKGVYLYEKHSR